MDIFRENIFNQTNQFELKSRIDKKLMTVSLLPKGISILSVKA